MGGAGGERVRPQHFGIISLTRTTDERCTILQRLGGTMYSNVDEIQDPTFLNAWDSHSGEKGPLVKAQFIGPSLYGGQPDEALVALQ